jgi:hypothetical protein
MRKQWEVIEDRLTKVLRELRGEQDYSCLQGRRMMSWRVLRVPLENLSDLHTP